MNLAVLHWFRTSQRPLARAVLTVFCLAWLQVAAMPCVMASSTAADVAASTATMIMPDGATMAPGEHCPYCPPEPLQGSDGSAHGVCSYPHAPQVDSRVGFMAALLGPPTSSVLFDVFDAAACKASPIVALTPPPAQSNPLAVRFCRFLE